MGFSNLPSGKSNPLKVCFLMITATAKRGDILTTYTDNVETVPSLL